jgi:predicted dehydrogenase
MVLVDLDHDRLQRVATRYGISQFGSDYRSVIETVDGAIVATPARTHFHIALDFLKAGVHVLCEKPLAESANQVTQLLEAAEGSGVSICVNNTRRLFPVTREIRSWIQGGKLGRLQSIEFHLGEKFDWPSAGDSYFGIRGSGRGVLSDIGAHVIDLVCWWLGGKPRITKYQDDFMGGTEAVARLGLEHEGCNVDIHLSWLSKLDNVYRIRGDVGTIEGDIHDYRSFTVVTPSGERRKIQAGRGPATYSGFATVLIENFIEVINGKVSPIISAGDVFPSIALIDECYGRRLRFQMPWFEPGGGTQ